MPKLLVVEASPRGEHSISRSLAKTFVEQWKTAHKGGEVVEHDLAKRDLPYMNLPWLGASLTPAEKHTPEMKDVLQVSDELVAELLAADHVAISTPVYNYNIPANLKSYGQGRGSFPAIRLSRRIQEVGFGLSRQIGTR